MVGVVADQVIVELEARVGPYNARVRDAERKFAASTRRMSGSAQRMETNVTRSFLGVGRIVTALTTGLGVREIVRYADAWTQAGNKIAAASQISGIQSRSLSDLNDIATETRSGLEETVDLYSRLLRVSGPLGKSEEEVARATEIAAKAFKAGGAAATEQAAGILQLGQALGSGFLQGDELRSLRENAPLIAQAIADEFETTIGGLKELGAEGALTSARVFDAIIKGQSKIQGAFATTDATIGEGFRLAKNALIELIGAFDQGANASSNLGGSLASIAQSLQSSTDAARRFGAQFSEAIAIVQERIDFVTGAFQSASDMAGVSFSDIVDFVYTARDAMVNLAKTVIAAGAGAIAAVSDLITGVTDGVSNFAKSQVNGAITAIETLINGAIRGINALKSSVDGIKGLINKALPGALEFEVKPNLPPVSLDRFKKEIVESGALGIGDAFDEEFTRVKNGLDSLVDESKSARVRINQAGNRSDEDALFSIPVLPPSGGASGSNASSAPASPTASGGSGGGGRSGRSEAQKEFNSQLQEAKRLLEENLTAEEKLAIQLRDNSALLPAVTAQIRKEAAARGEVITQAQAEALAKIEISEANKRLIDEASGLAQASEDLKSNLKTAFEDVITGAASFEDALKNVLLQLAKVGASNAFDSLSTALSGGGKSGGGGGFFGSLLGGLFGFNEGGYTGNGATMEPKGIVHGGEYVFSKKATQKAGVANLEALHNNLKGFSNGGFVGSGISSAGANLAASTRTQPEQQPVNHMIELQLPEGLSPKQKQETIQISQGVSVRIVEATAPSVVANNQLRGG